MPYAPKPQVEAWRPVVAQLAGPLPVSYLLGLMDRLSGGDENFEGSLGGRGLYQIHPSTAERLDEDPAVLWDPEANIEIAVLLLLQRSEEIQAKDPTMAQRPGDLGLLTTASYLYGPGIVLPAITSGATADQVFAKLDPKIGQFAVDVFMRGQAYSETGEPPTITADTSAEPKAKTSPLRTLGYLAGFAALAVGGIFLVNKVRKPQPKRKRRS